MWHAASTSFDILRKIVADFAKSVAKNVELHGWTAD